VRLFRIVSGAISSELALPFFILPGDLTAWDEIARSVTSRTLENSCEAILNAQPV